MSEEEILDYDENIYQKLARATARVVDINLGKTTLADLLDGYTKSIVLQRENKKEKGRIEVLENTLREILHFCNHLHNDCKYNLNDGHIRKIRNICKRELSLLGDKE